MDKTGSTSTLAPKTTRRNFFQWAVKWFYANVPEDTSKKFDVPSIICLLQAVGFKLREFDKRNPVIADNDEVKNNSIRITMECGSSKMTAILEMDDVTCECRNHNEASNGSLWSVTGTGPATSTDSVNKFEETGSNLLPEMSKEITVIVRDVVHRLLKIINNYDDDDELADSTANLPNQGMNTTITKNPEVKEGSLVRSYTDFYRHVPRTASKLNSQLASARCVSSSKSAKNVEDSQKPTLKRQGTYDLDEDESMEEPRPSPPKLASSPVLHQLYSTFAPMTHQSEDENGSLVDYVVQAYELLDKAMNSIIYKMDETRFVKPAPPSLMSSSFCSSSPSRTRASNVVYRSISNASARSTSSNTRLTTATATGKSTVGQKIAPTIRASALPPMRDRSSSLSAAQRPQPSLKALAGHRRSTVASSTLALTPRTTTANSKLPTSKMTYQTRGQAVERPALTTKRRSPDPKSHVSSPALASQARGNVSLIKAPTFASRLNTSVSTKFGYTATKK